MKFMKNNIWKDAYYVIWTEKMKNKNNVLNAKNVFYFLE